MSIKKHARYGFSSWKRIKECVVSVFLARHFPDVQTESSREGDVAHDIMEVFVAQKLSGQPYVVPDFAMHNGKPRNGEMIKHVKDFAEYCYAVVSPFLQYEHDWFVEQRVVADEDLDVWGTADVLFFYKTPDGLWHIIVIDFKYGRGVAVEAEENMQVIGYLIAGIITFENEIEGAYFADAEGHIFQPRMDHETAPQFYTRDELFAYAPEMLEKIELSESWFKAAEEDPNYKIPDSELTKYQRAGSWCQFCRAKGVCRAYGASIGVGKAIKLLALPSVQNATQKEIKEGAIIPHLIETGELSEEDMAWIALNHGKLDAFGEAVKVTLKEMLKRGKKNPYVKLGKGSPTREWLSDEKSVIAGLEQLGVEEPVVTITKVISLGEAERILGKGKADHLTQIAYTTTRLARVDEDVEPAPPRGMDVANLMGIPPRKKEAA